MTALGYYENAAEQCESTLHLSHATSAVLAIKLESWMDIRNIQTCLSDPL